MLGPWGRREAPLDFLQTVLDRAHLELYSHRFLNYDLVAGQYHCNSCAFRDLHAHFCTSCHSSTALQTPTREEAGCVLA